MLQAIDLTKRYEDGNLALDALNLEIKPGEIFSCWEQTGQGRPLLSISSSTSSNPLRAMP